MTQKEPRLSLVGIKALNIFLRSKSKAFSGVEICSSTGSKPGTIYPFLKRLEKCGWLVSKIEDESLGDRRGPRRRLYRLTPLGVSESRNMLKELEN